MAFSFRRKIRSFWSDTAANMTLTLGLASSVLLAAAGGAIDFARWTLMKSEMQTHLDAAVLAGTQKLSETKGDQAAALKVATDYFAAAVKGQPDLADNTVVFKINQTGTGVISEGNANIETSLLNVVGISKLPLLQKSEADLGNTSGAAIGNLEIALVLDVTGSMCADGTGPCSSGSKFTALKTSANNLIDAVVWADQSTYTSRVSVIPFNTAIRVGPDGGGSAMMASLTNLPATWTGWYRSCISGYSTTTTEGQPDWVCTQEGPAKMPVQPIIPCVTGRYINANSDPFDQTDDAPGAGKWFLANDGSRAYASDDSSDTPMTSGLGALPNDLSTAWNYGDDGFCWKTTPANQIMPLSSDKSALKSKIDGLVAQGATSGQLGISFGWFSISPRWTNIWPAASAPGSYADLTTTNASGGPKLRKIAVFMTDGVFNSYRGWVEETMKPTFADEARNMCKAMKDAGVEIYTIGYELDALPAADRDRAKDVLKDCGSDIAHFYDSIDAQKLATAFADIASAINGGVGGIRLTR